MTNVFDRLTGQEAIADDLRAAARAARALAARLDAGTSDDLFLADDEIPAVDAGWSRASMTHSWLFTGPPGSGRSVAAQCFAAALQCQAPDATNVG